MACDGQHGKRAVPWPASVLAGVLLLAVASGCASEVSQSESPSTSPGLVVKGEVPAPGTSTSTATTSTPTPTTTIIASSIATTAPPTAPTAPPTAPTSASASTASASASSGSPSGSTTSTTKAPSVPIKTPLPSISIIQTLPTLKVVTPTPRAPTCAQGGVCHVGEKGPGGGIVVFAGRGQFICGVQRNRVCSNIEVAPVGWNGTREDAYKPWCPKLGDRYGNVFTNEGLGWGLANTTNIVAQCGADSAAGLAASYRGGGLSDWYLPAKNEVDELYRQRAMIGSPLLPTCWSSTQVGFDTGGAWLMNYRTGRWEITYMDFPHSCVRPIRAF